MVDGLVGFRCRSDGCFPPGDLVPGAEAGSHLAAVVIGAQAVAAGSEVRGDAAERGQEPLGVSGRGEPFHGSFALTGGLMGVLRPII